MSIHLNAKCNECDIRHTCDFRCESYHLNLVMSNFHMKCIVCMDVTYFAYYLVEICIKFHRNEREEWVRLSWTSERIKYQYYWKQMMQNKQWQISLRHSMDNVLLCIVRRSKQRLLQAAVACFVINVDCNLSLWCCCKTVSDLNIIVKVLERIDISEISIRSVF